MSEQQHGSNAYFKRQGTRYRPQRTMARLGSRIVEPTAEFLGVEGNQARKLKCGCGWSGPLAKLKNPKGGPMFAGRNLGPGFPVCPRCKTDRRLEA